MAKKEIKGAVEGEQVEGKDAGKVEAAAKMREAKASAAAGDKFTFAGEPTSKLAPQAQGIVNIIKEAGKKGCSRAELVAAMEGVITTRQPMQRILAYYQKQLIEVGAVTFTKAG